MVNNYLFLTSKILDGYFNFMKNKLLIAFVLFASFHLIIAQQPYKIQTVVIDPGHGGKDPGACGSIIKEKDVVLKVALKVGQYISENLPDVNVVYTRKSDVFIPLDDRANIANKANADLYISIHANSIKNSFTQGTETFVLGLHRSQDNLEVAKKENSVIILEDNYNVKYEGFDPNSSESYILFELMQNAYLDQSINMASLVENQFANRIGRNSRGVKQAGFLVLRQTAMPSILIELGFLTNKNEEAFLESDEGQSYLASAIYRAFKEYKQNYETSSIDFANIKPEVKPDTKPIPLVAKPSRLIYKIQIASSSEKIDLKKGVYKKFSDIEIYQDANLFKYTVEKNEDFDDIQKILVKVKKVIPDAFIVAFENDQRISVSDARKKK